MHKVDREEVISLKFVYEENKTAIIIFHKE